MRAEIIQTRTILTSSIECIIKFRCCLALCERIEIRLTIGSYQHSTHNAALKECYFHNVRNVCSMFSKLRQVGDYGGYHVNKNPFNFQSSYDTFELLA